MIKVLEVLLRCNFRCGRMLYSRTDAMAWGKTIPFVRC